MGMHARPYQHVNGDNAANAATRKPRKVSALKASARAAVASAPLYSKFAASQRLDAAAARAARLAQRRGMPEAAASASGDGMVTPPACSRAGSLTEHDSPAMSTASPNGMDSSPQPASSVAASATSSPSRAPANAVAARRTAKAIVERRIRERAAAVSAASSHTADSGENRREVKNPPMGPHTITARVPWGHTTA